MFQYPTHRLATDAPYATITDRLRAVLRSGRDQPARPARAHRFGHDDDSETDGSDDVLAAVREEAAALHERLAHRHGVFVAELLGATGSGKTRLLERLVERAPTAERIGVIVGDVAGEDDARRLRAHGVEAVTVNTGKECHLDPTLVSDALSAFDLDALDTLFVENVGNMVCPADFPLGAAVRVLVVSTTEGDDVVRKHPLLFQTCDAAVVNKTDLAAAVGADPDRMTADIDEVAPDTPVFRTSARDDTGIEAVAAFLERRRAAGHGRDVEPSTNGSGSP
jgi:hydrogenase nickel incorporation protein HypB